MAIREGWRGRVTPATYTTKGANRLSTKTRLGKKFGVGGTTVIGNYEFEDQGDGTVFIVTNLLSQEQWRFEPEDEPWEDMDDLFGLFLQSDEKSV